jgi:hypothetical protein
VVEVLYQKAQQQAPVDPTLVAALDPAVKTLAALSATTGGFLAPVMSGKATDYCERETGK